MPVRLSPSYGCCLTGVNITGNRKAREFETQSDRSEDRKADRYPRSSIWDANSGRIELRWSLNQRPNDENTKVT